MHTEALSLLTACSVECVSTEQCEWDAVQFEGSAVQEAHGAPACTSSGAAWKPRDASNG